MNILSKRATNQNISIKSVLKCRNWSKIFKFFCTVFNKLHNKTDASQKDKNTIYLSSTVDDEVQEVVLEEWQQNDTVVEDEVWVGMNCTGTCTNQLFRVELGGKQTGLLDWFIRFLLSFWCFFVVFNKNSAVFGIYYCFSNHVDFISIQMFYF